MNLAETASPVEILWTCLGVVGLIVFGILSWRAAAALQALTRLHLNGGRKIAGRTILGIQVALAGTQVIVIVTGVVQALVPPVNPNVPVPLPSLVATLGVVGIEAILLGIGVFALVRGDVLDRYFAAHDTVSADATSRERHAESMTELVHNTEITTEARDGAIEAYHAANNLNEKIIGVQREIAETNKIAGEAADKNREYMEQLEGERKEREGC